MVLCLLASFTTFFYFASEYVFCRKIRFLNLNKIPEMGAHTATKLLILTHIKSKSVQLLHTNFIQYFSGASRVPPRPALCRSQKLHRQQQRRHHQQTTTHRQQNNAESVDILERRHGTNGIPNNFIPSRFLAPTHLGPGMQLSPFGASFLFALSVCALYTL